MPTNTSWYHANAKPVSRSDGKSYVGLVAYTIDHPIYDQYNKRTCGRNHAGEVASWGIVAGGPCPSSFLDKSQIDKTANAYETHKKNRINAHLSIHFDFALWRNGTPEQNEELTRRIAQRYADRHKVLVVYGVHAPSGEGSDLNQHGHFAPTMLRVTPEGFGEKARELQDGERKRELIWARAMIAEETNRFLQSVNSDERVSHESYRARGILKQPMVHMGAKAWQAEKRGVKTELGEKNRSIRAENAAFETQQQKHTDNIIRYDGEIKELKTQRLSSGTGPMETTDHQNQKREDTVAADVGKMDKLTEGVSEFWMNHQREMEDEENERKAKERDGWRKVEPDNITDARSRWAEACGKYSDLRDPYGSLATAARAEGAAFRKGQEDLRQQEAHAEGDPTKQAMLRLRRHIEASEYFALTSERLAGISKVIGGPRDGRGMSESEEFYREEAAKYREIAKSEREKLSELRELADTKNTEKLHEGLKELDRQARENPWSRRMNRTAEVPEREQMFGVPINLPADAPNRDRPQNDQRPAQTYDPEAARQNPYDRVAREDAQRGDARRETTDARKEGPEPELSDAAKERLATLGQKYNAEEREIQQRSEQQRSSGMGR